MALSSIRRAALVTLDLQPLICSFMDDGTREALVSRVNTTMAQARARNVPIAHVRVAFQPGHPEIHESHPIMGPAKQGNVLVDGTPEAALLPELERDPSEPVFTKVRVNAFTTTGLASWVSAHQTTELVMCGVATGLVVLKTAVHAIDQDLEVTVLSDLCVDANQARHDACMDAVFPTLARVMPSDEWLATLDGSPQKTAAGALRGLL